MSATPVSRGSRPQLLSVQQLLSRPEERQPERPAALPPLRLTRRGRIVLIGIPLVLLAALLLSLAGFFISPAKASDSAADLETTSAVTVTVQPGQSLWGIAATVAPERDARDVVADIVQLNNLSAGAVFPGQQLFVPAG
ncbi:UNVERIFIED_CONTAM: LysM peptidoglycan-binding domain-containing protein [Actinomycetes bacterium ARC8]|nr:LysM peptidoglycan-binding domain-containing protein [Actinomycetes bacterium ARC8]